jgi:hypothetical protein
VSAADAVLLLIVGGATQQALPGDFPVTAGAVVVAVLVGTEWLLDGLERLDRIG